VNRQELWPLDRFGRAGCFVILGGGDREDMQSVRGLADCVEMMAPVPEHLRDGIDGEDARVGRDQVGAVEVEKLQAFCSADGD